MTGVNRIAMVAGIVVAGLLTFAPARDGSTMTSRFVSGSQAVVQGARRVAVGMTGVVAGLFNQGATPVYAQDQDGSAQQAADFVWHGSVRMGQILEIKGVNGDIIAERAPGEEIEVRAE